MLIPSSPGLEVPPKLFLSNRLGKCPRGSADYHDTVMSWSRSLQAQEQWVYRAQVTKSMKLELKDITLRFEDRTLLDNTSLTIDQGDFIVIRGPSGSGKSSLLRLLNRLAEPSSGRIYVDETPLDDLEAPTFRRRVGYVPQTPVLIPGSVKENLTLPYRFRSSMDSSPDTSRFEADLKSLNLKITLADDTENLSVGEKQRITLLRTLSTNPDVILADEPTSALDPDSRTIVETRLKSVNRDRSTTIVLVTHLEFDTVGAQTRQFTIKNARLKEVT